MNQIKLLVNKRRLIVVKHARPKLGFRPANLALTFSLAYTWSIVRHMTSESKCSKTAKKKQHAPECNLAQTLWKFLATELISCILGNLYISFGWISRFRDFHKRTSSHVTPQLRKGLQLYWFVRLLSNMVQKYTSKLGTCECLWDASSRPGAETGSAAMQELIRTYFGTAILGFLTWHIF